jgi:hypothetical protein
MTILNNMATIGELEKLNTFLKYKLRYQAAESEKSAKKVVLIIYGCNVM